ncbi:hypothetical protein ACFE04_001979 [Oxalis oulophora]
MGGREGEPQGMEPMLLAICSSKANELEMVEILKPGEAPPSRLENRHRRSFLDNRRTTTCSVAETSSRTPMKGKLNKLEILDLFLSLPSSRRDIWLKFWLPRHKRTYMLPHIQCHHNMGGI